MRDSVHRHLGKVVAGAAVAAAGTAVMVGVTLPGTAGADASGGGATAARAARAGQEGTVRPGVVRPAPAEGDRGRGSDPLTGDETERAERIAADRRLLGAARNVAGGRGPQRLTVDLVDPADGGAGGASPPRRAEVTFYDYRNDTLVTKTVDLDTGKVEETGIQHGVQPPLSRAENTEAAKLLIADPLGAGLRADYQDATGKELTSPDQLLLDGAVYRAAPGTRPAVLGACGEHRCVRLFPKAVDGPWIDARSLVVDLSAGTVTKLDR